MAACQIVPYLRPINRTITTRISIIRTLTLHSSLQVARLQALSPLVPVSASQCLGRLTIALKTLNSSRWMMNLVLQGSPRMRSQKFRDTWQMFPCTWYPLSLRILRWNSTEKSSKNKRIRTSTRGTSSIGCSLSFPNIGCPSVIKYIFIFNTKI